MTMHVYVCMYVYIHIIKLHVNYVWHAYICMHMYTYVIYVLLLFYTQLKHL